MNVQRLACFRLVAADAQRLARFYERALDFQVAGGPESVTAAGADALSRAVALTLSLGDQRVQLLQFDSPGSAYPADVASSDNLFQHLALIVSDMDDAYAQLRLVNGWTPISTDGPQQLPPASGGVTAFKFRDPEGHPLELLAFPHGNTPDYWRARRKNGLFLGIDHSAISVSDVDQSVAFYQSMGLSVAHRSTNHGAEQGRLDHLNDPVVEVIAMKAPSSPPHVELLGYRQGRGQPPIALHANDVAATSMVFTADGSVTNDGPMPHVRDPDGHRSLILPEKP